MNYRGVLGGGEWEETPRISQVAAKSAVVVRVPPSAFDPSIIPRLPPLHVPPGPAGRAEDRFCRRGDSQQSQPEAAVPGLGGVGGGAGRHGEHEEDHRDESVLREAEGKRVEAFSRSIASGRSIAHPLSPSCFCGSFPWQWGGSVAGRD